MKLFEHFTYKVNEQGERIEKPEDYDMFKKYGSYTAKGEKIVPECRAFLEAETVVYTPDWMEFSKVLKANGVTHGIFERPMVFVRSFTEYTNHMGENLKLSDFIATEIVDGKETPLDESTIFHAQKIGTESNYMKYQQAESKVLYRGWRDVGSGEVMNSEGVKIMYVDGLVYSDGKRLETRNDFIKNGGELIFK